MIHINITVGDADFDGIIDRFSPILVEKLRESGNPAARLLSKGMPVGAAKAILRNLPKEMKERLTAELINAYGAQIIEKAEDLARGQGVGITVDGISASA